MLDNNSFKKHFLLCCTFILLAFFSVFLGCFSPSGPGGDNATITLNLAETSDSRAVTDFYPTAEDAILNELTYIITLTDTTRGGRRTVNVQKGARTVQVSVIPGRWNIKVEAYYLGNLYAGNSVTQDIRSGPNTVQMPMKPAYSVKFYGYSGDDSPVTVFVLRDEKVTIPQNLTNPTLAEGLYRGEPKIQKWYYSLDDGTGTSTEIDFQPETTPITPDIASIKETGNLELFPVWDEPLNNGSTGYDLPSGITYINQYPRDYTYLLASSVAAPSGGFPIGDNITGIVELTLIATNNAGGEVPIMFSGGSGSLFTIKSGASLTLGKGITLQSTTGSSTDFAPLVTVSSGRFTMRDGSKITGNQNQNTGQSGNGGGVFVASGSTFIMTGGSIQGNMAGNYGGGVYAEGTFKKTGGTIYGTGGADGNTANGAAGTPPNSLPGHAVCIMFGNPPTYRCRNSTAGPTVFLDSTKSGSAGGWE
jgi:hypothetical protein